MRINIVMDNKNNWYYERVPGLIFAIKKLGHSCQLLSKQQLIPANSDVTFFLGCEKYINSKIRQKSSYNIVVHASDLPKGKGMSPATWQILEGKNKIPVTLFEVADGFDTGDYYLKETFQLKGTELIDEWQKKLGECIDKMIIKFLRNIKKLKPIKQRGKPSFYKRRGPGDSRLDVNKSLKSQFNLLRVVDNKRYPAFFNYKGKQYILEIYKAPDISH
jgi:methionyl-tRNA formyltransferase